MPATTWRGSSSPTSTVSLSSFFALGTGSARQHPGDAEVEPAELVEGDLDAVPGHARRPRERLSAFGGGSCTRRRLASPGIQRSSSAAWRASSMRGNRMALGRQRGAGSQLVAEAGRPPASVRCASLAARRRPSRAGSRICSAVSGITGATSRAAQHSASSDASLDQWSSSSLARRILGERPRLRCRRRSGWPRARAARSPRARATARRRVEVRRRSSRDRLARDLARARACRPGRRRARRAPAARRRRELADQRQAAVDQVAEVVRELGVEAAEQRLVA